MKRALVTGGAGYIGSHLTKALRAAGWWTMSFDKRSPLPHALASSDVIGDLLNLSDVEYLGGHGFDVIFHLAALIDVEESQREPELYREFNVTATQNLLAAFPNTPVVFSSTAAVYAPSDAPLTEAMPLDPSSIYGETKLAAEMLVRAHGDHVILRFFNVAGCGEGRVDNHKTITHLIPKLVKSNGSGITVNGDDYLTHDGTCVRDYVHVQDIADAHLAAGERLLGGGTTLTANLGSGRGYSVYDVYRAATKALCVSLPPPVVGPRREGDPSSLVANIAIAREELGFEPKYSLEEIISSHRF